MSVESTTTIDGLNTSYPAITDPVHQGPQHLSLIKSVLKATFPGKDGNGFKKPITATEDELNELHNNALLNRLYPVGYLMINTSSSANPDTWLKFGTWARFGEGKLLISQQNGNALCDTAGKTGGSKDAVVVSHTHTETTANLAHTHTGTTSAASKDLNHSHAVTVAGVPDHTHTYNVQGSYKDPSGPATTATNYRAGNTGGAGAHTHTATADSADLNHTHTVTTNTQLGDHSHTINASGVTGVDANMPPYVTVYMWTRTA